MNYPNLSALLEAIVYLANEPVSLDAIQKALPNVDRSELRQTLSELVEQYRAPEHGIEIREVADGYRFSTKPEHHEVLKQFIKSQIPPTRLSLAALETLAVIAYKQPVTRFQVSSIRGVSSEGVLRSLVDRGLLQEVGRDDGPGRALLYGTTAQFLERIGLASLSDLPPIAPLLADAGRERAS